MMLRNVLVLMTGLVMAGNAAADVPKSLAGPHAHAAEVSGKLTLFRVQQEGLEIGPEDDRLDAEVLVTVDKAPDMVFGLKFHKGADPASGAIVTTLREAYLNQEPVTIQYPTSPGKKNVRIIWVQMTR